MQLQGALARATIRKEKTLLRVERGKLPDLCVGNESTKGPNDGRLASVDLPSAVSLSLKR